MSLALNVDLQSTPITGRRAARAVHVNRHSPPVFVDPSGRRARWCRMVLAAAAVVSLLVVVILSALTMTFVRSAAPEASGRALTSTQRAEATPSAVVTNSATAREAVAE